MTTPPKPQGERELAPKDTQKTHLPRGPQYLFWLCLCLGVSLRLWLSTIDHNFDVESYWIVAQLVDEGRSVYAETYRYNYGPIWFLLLKLLRDVTRLTSVDSIFHFHVAIAAFLTLVDSVIALTLRDKYGLKASLFFILNPVSILVTGHQSQFDNLAILVAWIGCCQLSKSGMADVRELTIGALLLGFSLATKHLLIFFPFWMWWLYVKSSIKMRAIVILLPWLIFLLLFVPFALDSASRTGIVDHVFNYYSSGANGLIAKPLELLFSFDMLGKELLNSVTKLTFVLALILSGPLVIARGTYQKQVETLLLLYLITLVAFSSSMMNQYLSIPLIAIARYYRLVFSWAYSAIATYILITNGNGIFEEGLSHLVRADYSIAQLFLVLILFSVLTAKGSSEAYNPTR